MEDYNREFIKTFDKLAYKYGHFQVFENFLDCAINGFCFNYAPETMENIRKRYTQDERYIFGELIKLWILICDKKIKTDSCWHDFFGNFYEENALSKKNGFAQFFTPEDICNFMVKIVDPVERETMAEPACGSGRFNLAAHAHNPKIFHHGNDLDFTCVKMAALNFMIHGIKGIVTCDDALSIPGNSFRCAFIVNDSIVPSLFYTEDYTLTQNYLHEKLNPGGAYFQKIQQAMHLLSEKTENTGVESQEKERETPFFDTNQPIIEQNGQIALF